MALSGQQYERLSAALAEAFTAASLSRMLEFRLNRRLDLLVSPNDGLLHTCFQLIRIAEMEGWTERLVLEAHWSNPGNTKLATMAYSLGFSSMDPRTQDLEVIVRARPQFQDTSMFLASLARVENCVCCISYPTPNGLVSGSGFLIGPRLVLTNFHVVEPLTQGLGLPSQVSCRFDYKRLGNGLELLGSSYALADQWLFSYSRSSGTGTKVGLDALQLLDYAILRLAASVGETPVGHSPEPGASPRGWLRIDSGGDGVSPEDIILILQHPEGVPQQLAMGKVLARTANGARIRHDVSTLPGSSGSPCLTVDLRVCGLHRAGAQLSEGSYNEAISIEAIVAHLSAQGLEHLS
jgi:hypothetical protein